MLARHGEVAWAAQTLQLEQMAPRITDRMILAIDPGDLNRDGAPRSEGRGRLRRGRDKEVPFGITRVSLPKHPDKPLWMVIVRHGKHEPLVPVTTRPVRG